MLRSSFLTSDDSFVTVGNLSVDDYEISTVSSNLDVTMVINRTPGLEQNNMNESVGQVQQDPTQQVYRQDESESEAVDYKKPSDGVLKPRKRKLVTPRKYFLDLLRVPKSSGSSHHSRYKRKMTGINKSLRVPLRNLISNSRIPPPTIHFKKHLYQKRSLKELNDGQYQQCIHDDRSTEAVRRLFRCTACHQHVVNSCTPLNNSSKD
ncbi:hypothetical protein Y032_0014g2451 [Ancylostoma ceylanicum]|uniref:Uncharacterized protein n=1 Tax=Ancylostoma ceylanicum TaxID=53326 RepID=A0A016VA66_9BILA|nr:hypothetical protein Y032_0014g2451 [Ancylostoma ceylanicum]